jgi:hypothetical protein
VVKDGKSDPAVTRSAGGACKAQFDAYSACSGKP